MVCTRVVVIRCVKHLFVYSTLRDFQGTITVPRGRLAMEERHFILENGITENANVLRHQDVICIIWSKL